MDDEYLLFDNDFKYEINSDQGEKQPEKDDKIIEENYFPYIKDKTTVYKIKDIRNDIFIRRIDTADTADIEDNLLLQV